MENPRDPDGVPIFDNLDVDMVVKVLMNTIFSPFFVFFIPVFYFFNGAKITDPIIVATGVYYLLITGYWSIKWISTLYRNQGSLFFAPKPFDWGEQVVVITGGSSGVGELLANTLAVRNVNVVVLDVKPIETENYNISFYKCDVSKWEEVEAVSKQIIEEIGEPTMLINNAGVVQGKLLVDLSPEDINQTFGVNTLAHFWTLKAFLPSLLKAKKGHIVTVASILGTTGVARMTDYCASKAALISLNESLRYELDKRYKCPEIRTTVVMPSHISTPLFSHLSLPESSVHKFFMPVVPPIAVVKRIIEALDSQHSQTIILPFYANFLPLLGFLPSFAKDFCRYIAGADNAMERFVKVSGRRPEEGPVPVPSTATNGKAA